MVVISTLAYLAYNDFWPFNILRFFLIHYLVWTLPFLAAGGLAGVRLIVRESRWGVALSVVIATLLVVSYRLHPPYGLDGRWRSGVLGH